MSFQDLYSSLARPHMILALACVMDFCIGDPRLLPHPVKGIGRAVMFLEGLLFATGQEQEMMRIEKRKYREWIGGTVIVVIVSISTFVLFHMVNSLFFSSRFYPAVLSFMMLMVMVYLAGTTIAARGLIDSVRVVTNAVARGDIDTARSSLGNIVGRDTGKLDEQGILRAAIESIAENASDGIVAPLFFFAIGGLPLAMTYKAINTMDSMVGYKNQKYRYFGWAAARLDDIANYIPARITGMLIAVASAVVLRSTTAVRKSLEIMGRDGRKHPSPNSGVPEAAMAGALGVRLGGPSFYDGVPSDKPLIGDERTGNYGLAARYAVRIVKIVSLMGAALAVLALAVGSGR